MHDASALCRKFRKVCENVNPETVEDADRRRTVQHHYTDHGKMRFNAELDADEGARLLAELEIARGCVSAETRATTADALMVIIESFLADGPKARAGGAPTEVRLHVEKAELEAKGEGAFVENAGCLAVSAETARRLCCDAAVVEVAHGAGGTIDTKRRSRTIPAAMRGRSTSETSIAADFPGVLTLSFWMPTTSFTSPMEEGPSSRTSPRCAEGTTRSCMSINTRSSVIPPGSSFSWRRRAAR